MKLEQWIGIVACLVLAFGVARPTAADETTTGDGTLPRLFEVTGSKAYTLAPDDPGVVRRQAVTVETDNLTALDLPVRLRVDLFGDERVVRFDKRHETLVGPVLLGHVETADGEIVPESVVTLAWGGGAVTVDLILPDGQYSMHPTPGGGLVLDAIDESLRPLGADPIPATGLQSLRPPIYVAKDAATRIDVLVVYTGEARAGAGGVNALEQRVATGIAQLNQAFFDSGVDTSVRMVHIAEIPYIERNWDIGFDVEALQRKGDGLLDDAHTWRDEYGADLVAMIGENSTGACGIAYLMDGATNAAFEAEAFSYTARACLNGSYTFPHELAHNMGSNHARNDPIKEGAYDFSYAWKDPARGFRTLLAYPCSGSGPCTLLLRFSNPQQTWNGAPLGDFQNDNTRSLQGVRPVVANFRQQRTVRRGRVELVSTSATVAENGGSVTVRARRVDGASGAVSVAYRTVASSATAGADFVTTEGRLAWNDGQGGQLSFDVPVVDDAVEEATETFRVELSDIQGGATLGSASFTVTIQDDDEEPFQPFTCVANATTMCLEDGRFQVRLTFRANGEQGDGQVVEGAGSADSGLYYLFDDANWEMLVKVLDGCAINNRFWVLAAATTDVGYTLEVVDSRTGVTRRYTNPVGRASPALVETSAFATCSG